MMTTRLEFLLTPREVARMLACSTELLRKWRERGTGPRFVHMDGLIRYQEADVQAWIADNRKETTDDASDI